VQLFFLSISPQSMISGQNTPHRNSENEKFTVNVPVLYYHLVKRPPAGASSPSIYMEPERFERQLRVLRWMGFRDIGLDEFMDCLEGGRRVDGRRVMITFDDGHVDNFTVARPILSRHGFKATVFVVAGHVGGRLRLRSSVDPDGERILDADQIRRMVDEGFQIQSHGMSHANLADLPPEKAREEMVRSREALETLTGRPVRYFAYPYGSFKPIHLEMAEQAGYRAAFSTVRGRRHAPDERYCLKRIPVHHERGLLSFVQYLTLKSYKRAQRQLDRLRGTASP